MARLPGKAGGKGNGRAWILGLCLLLPAAAFALPSDREEPIYIEADSVEIDDARGISIYRGNVRYTQGTTELTADEATVYSKDRKLRKLVAKGRPAHYSTLPEGEQEKMAAEALTIIYLADQEVYEFHGQAHLWHEDNEFFGAFISYDAQNDRVNARKGERGEDRVRVIIMPEKKKREDSPPATPE
ncbi:MAG TPA: lipopolysaccharide transport periplasmic protein LptA [Gammaproteobacteria bacterium]|nr:lipopolysaccharide transport periplasmic protein LptA [Gammaproteobacteria bacterium]